MFLGTAVSVFMVIILGPDMFLILTLILITLMLVMCKRKIEVEGLESGDTEDKEETNRE